MEGENRGQAAAGADVPEGLLHLLYDVALDPARLPALAEAWEAHLAAGGAADGPDLAAHVARARRFLDRLPAGGRDEDARSVLSAIPRAAAFVSDGVTRVTACNRAAAILFGIADGSPLTALPFEAEELATLSATVRKVARRQEKTVNLRLRAACGGARVLRVSPLEPMGGRPMALVISAEPVWPEGFNPMVQETFGLTSAEVGIVRGLTLGHPIRDIAEARGRSVDTVRTQMRSIHAKTETHSQVELVRRVMGLMDLVLAPAGPGADLPQGRLEELAPRSLTLPDGRRLDWLGFGDPDGMPVLHLHGDFGLVRWSAPAEAQARARGLRVIVPIRAGYGHSDPLPPGAPLLTCSVADLAALVDHLGIERARVLSLGADLRVALALAEQRPGLFTGIVACALDLPGHRVEPEERAARWPCFLQENARRSPGMLGFLVHAAFAHARQFGKDQFLLAVVGGAVADRAALRDPDLREAILRGSEVCLGRDVSAHEAFTRGLIDRTGDWRRALVSSRVPIRLLQGAEDPLAPPDQIRALADAGPRIAAEIVPSAGRLLHLAQWGRTIECLRNFINE